MTGTEEKPPIKVLYSLDLWNPENIAVFSELRDELADAGYPTEVDIRPASGQFSATASLGQVLILVGGVGVAGAAVFSKQYLELAAEYAWKQTEAKLSKLKSRKPESEKLAIVVTVDVDGLQVKNALYKGPGDIKEFPTRPDRPHGHVIEVDENDDLIIKRSDGSAAQRWVPPQ